MIFDSGYCYSEAWQVRECRTNGDQSFSVISSSKFLQNLPCLPGTIEGGVILHKGLANVRPHVDPWCGVKLPYRRRAVFWLLKSPKPVIFGCNQYWQEMYSGDYVVFNDNLNHWVIADRVWLGASWQMNIPKGLQV